MKLFITSLIILIIGVFFIFVIISHNDNVPMVIIKLDGIPPTPIVTPSPTSISMIVDPLPPVQVITVESKTIKVYVDTIYGFYKIRGNGNNTLGNITINQNDTIQWINDDFDDYPVYVISKEQLWTGYNERLLANFKQISHTFNQTGTFTVMTGRGTRTNEVMEITVT